MLSVTAALLGGPAMMAGLSGCSSAGQAAATRTPGPDVTILTGAMQSEADLVALYDAVLTAHQDLGDRLRPLRDHHAQHLAVLRNHYVPGTRSGTVTPAPRSTATAPDGTLAALARLRAAERRAAAARADEVGRAAPGLAQLLASIGACEAGHAQVLR